jgi:hypothetical protein
MGAMQMRRKVATAIVMLALLVFAGVPAKADASSPDQNPSDLSSLPEIESYLGSIGVDIGSVVIQQGRLNYAGPNCPGADWNCTTASMVVQLTPATVPAANLVDCTPAVNITLLGLNECVIVQSSVLSLVETSNSATCKMSASDGAKQKCKVKQSSKKGNNYAEVRASTKQWGGAPQGGSQTAMQDANIEQTSDTGHNTAKITQTIEQTLGVDPPTSVTQEQEARQTATVKQTAYTSGSNWSWVAQYLSQEENACGGADITQKQNAASTEPNQEASITQTSGTGDNTSSSNQKLDQHQAATSDPGPVTQMQGTEFNSGQKMTVTQTTVAPGVSRSNPTQEENQDQDADTTGALLQPQFGPQDCCSTQNGGTAANVNHVIQSNVQSNDSGGSSQSSIQRGQCMEIGSGANCTLDQTYTSNTGTVPFSQTGPAVFSDRACTDTGEGAVCSNPD